MKHDSRKLLLASIACSISAIASSYSMPAVHAQSDLTAAPIVTSKTVPGKSVRNDRLQQRSAASSTKLPSVPSVESMTSAGLSTQSLLSRLPSESAFDNATNSTKANTTAPSDDSATPVTSDIDNYVFGSPGQARGWNDSVATWAAPNFYSQPLYFEQVNLERYDSKTPPIARPAISYAHFLATIPVLPYKIGNDPYRSRAYSLGHWRPGDRVPHQIHWRPATKRGVLYQAAATTGIIFVVP